MTVPNVLKLTFLTLTVAALAIPLHVNASEPDGLASQFQATAAEAAASFRKELKVDLAKSIRPSLRLTQLADVDRKERQTSLDPLNGAD